MQLAEDLVQNFLQTASTLAKLKSVSTELSQIHANYNSKTQIGNTFPNQTLYKNLSECFHKWSILAQKQSININENFVENIKYTHKEINCLNDLMNIRTKTGIVYYSNWRNLENKKTKLFKMGFNKEWKLDLTDTGLTEKDVINNETLSKYLMLPDVFLFSNVLQ